VWAVGLSMTDLRLMSVSGGLSSRHSSCHIGQEERVKPSVHDSRHHHLAAMSQDGPMYKHPQAERESLLQDKSLMM
jgi:hypothetical protein